MNFYQEITLIDHVEISAYFIWSKLYGQLHLAFVEQKDESNQVAFAVSFPQYQYDLEKKKITLGKKIRIFAKTREALMVLNLNHWLARLTDYVELKQIEEVPKDVSGYAIYQRHQVKSNPERLARRYAKRHNVSYEEALGIYQSMDMQRTNLPYVQMKSLSKDQSFRLFIEKKIVDSKSVEASFTTYGLNSKETAFTVPEF